MPDEGHADLSGAGGDLSGDRRERVVVALTGGPEGDTLIRRAARIAARVRPAQLLAVHVARNDSLAGSSVAELDRQRLLVESLGGSYHSIVGDDVPGAVLAFAMRSNATQLVVGASRRRSPRTGAGTGAAIARRAGEVDVHLVSHDYVGKGRVLPRLRRGLTTRRQLAGLLAAVVLFAILTPVCAALRDDLTLGSELLLFLLVVVIVSLVGGFLPAFAAAVVASLLVNYYFVLPVHRFAIARGENILALAVFVVIATLVSRVVDLAARRTAEAARSNAEAETLSALAGSLLRGEQALPALLQRVRETFGVPSATLLRREPAAAGWTVLAALGEPAAQPGDGTTALPVGEELTLVLGGPPLDPEDQRVLVAFAAQVAVAYRQRLLAEAAQAAVPLAEADRQRTALLNAVSHDLRTPIATAKAAVSSLRSAEVAWTVEQRQELLAGADGALDRLTALVTNLLDLSRLRAGALTVVSRPVGLDEVVNRTLEQLEPDRHVSDRVELAVPADLPSVYADPGLLERVLANLVENALRHAPAGTRVRLAASAGDTAVELRIVDHGPGIAAAERIAVFEPFQRRGDSGAGGVGLGLAIARGFVAAMGGSLLLDDTPGGGLSAVLSLPVADRSRS